MHNICVVKGLLFCGGFFWGGEGGSIKLNAGCASRLVKRTLDLAVTATIIQLCV